jgi:MFS transporter, DHA2 family, multidrug resistance protein
MPTRPALEGGAPAAWRPRASPWVIAGSVMLATFMEVLDTSVANVALPHIAGSLSATTDEATWVLTSYLVSNAIVLPATGWLSSVFGRKRFLMSCIGLFTLASLVAGLAPTLGILILARVVQGAGGGALQPISQAILLESFEPAMRGTAMAVFGLGVVVAPIIGPTLGGYLTDHYTWRWVFYINLPVGILALLLLQAFVEDPPYVAQARPTRIDYAGFGLLALWLGTLQVMLDKGQESDWFAAPWIRWFAVISALAMIAFIAREFKARQPIVNLRVLGNRNFAVGTLLMTVVGVVLYSTIALVPLFLQDLMGYTALLSGLAVSPRGLGALAAMAVMGRLVRKLDNRWLIAAGFVALGVSTFLLGDINLEIGTAVIVWPNVLSGLATGFIFVPLTTITMGTLRTEEIGTGTGIFNLMRNIGGSVGISAVATMLARGAQAHQALMVGDLSVSHRTFSEELAVLQQALAQHVGPPAAARMAYGLMYQTLLQQATLWAYVDNFRLLALLCLLCVPLVLLFRRVRPSPPSSAVH